MNMFSRHNSSNNAVINNKKKDIPNDAQNVTISKKVQYSSLSQNEPLSITNSTIITPQAQNTTQRSNAINKDVKSDGSNSHSNNNNGNSISNINISVHINGAASEGDVSGSTDSSNLCRFCFDKVTENHSSCHCKNKLCKECLKNELKMTESRENRLMMCTVCKQPYDITYLPPTPKNFASKIQQSCQFIYRLLFSKQHSHLQGIRDPTSQDVKILIGLFISLVIWESTATYTLLYPKADLQANESSWKAYSFYHFAYLGLTILDSTICTFTAWMFQYVQAFRLTTNALLMIGSIMRVSIILENANWDNVLVSSSSTSMIWSSAGATVICGKSVAIAIIDAWKRYQVRKVKLMVGDKGPFNLNTPTMHVPSIPSS